MFCTWVHKDSAGGTATDPRKSDCEALGQLSKGDPRMASLICRHTSPAWQPSPSGPARSQGGLPCPDLVTWVGKDSNGLKRAQALLAEPLQRPHHGNHTEGRGRSCDSGGEKTLPRTPPPAASFKHCLCLPKWQPHRKPPLPPGGPCLILPAQLSPGAFCIWGLCIWFWLARLLSATPHTCSPALPAPHHRLVELSGKKSPPSGEMRKGGQS